MAKQISEEKKLHIGYLIYNFFELEQFFPRKPLLEQYNQNQFEVFAYVDSSVGFDELVVLMPQIHWRNIAEYAVDTVQKVIRKDKLNFLIDLSSIKYPRFLSILSSRMAPVQACFVGQFNSLKLHTVDYLFTDRFCDPLGNAVDYFTESPIYLPQTHFCYTPSKKSTIPQRVPCKQNGYVTFGCFHDFVKLTDDFLCLWAKILQAVPESRLIIKSRIFGSGYGCQETRFRLKRIGFPIGRVELIPAQVEDEVLYGQTDIMLGVYPYQNGYKICEAIYHGIPVVQLIGQRHSVRLGYSVLKNLGLEECIVFNEAEYIDAAVRLSSNVYKLVNLHKNLQFRLEKSALMDTRRFVGGVEKVYLQIWREYEEIPKLENMKKEIRGLLITMKDGLGFVYSAMSDEPQEQTIIQVLEDIAEGTACMKLLICRHEKLSPCHHTFGTVATQSKAVLKLYRQKKYHEVRRMIEHDLYPLMEQLQKFLQ